MQNIIKKAIEGGYRLGSPEVFDGILMYNKYEPVCDPLFWQALGKAKGWNEWKMEEIRNNFFQENFRTEGDEPMGFNSAVKYLEEQIK